VVWCSSVERGLVCTLLFHPQPGRGSSSSSSNTQPSADAMYDTLGGLTCHTARERCRRWSAAFSILPVPFFNLTTQHRERHPLGGPLSEGRRRRQRRRHLHISFIRWTGLDWTVLGLDCNQIGHLPSHLHSLHFILPSSSTQTYNRPARARILYPHCASNTTFQLQRVLAALYLIRPIPDNRNRVPLRQSQQPLWKRSQ
jgi:hypothetical protein